MNRKDLLAEALELGLKFNTNISTKNLTNQVNNKKLELSNAPAKTEEEQEQQEAYQEIVELIMNNETLITITSLKHGHKEQVKGYEEASQLTNVPIELIKANINNENLIMGYRFKK